MGFTPTTGENYFSIDTHRRAVDGLPRHVLPGPRQRHRKGEVLLRGADEPDEDRAFHCLRASLQSQDWVVYSKPPFADAGQVLAYLGCYTHKTAIGNHRLIDFDGEHVRFRWRDYADGNRRTVMRLQVDEFIRRFLLHVLPRGFTRLRLPPVSVKDRPKKRRGRPPKKNRLDQAALNEGRGFLLRHKCEIYRCR